MKMHGEVIATWHLLMMTRDAHFHPINDHDVNDQIFSGESDPSVGVPREVIQQLPCCPGPFSRR